MYFSEAALTSFLTAMGLNVFKQFIDIYSFIYRSKCPNIHFEENPKSRSHSQEQIPYSMGYEETGLWGTILDQGQNVPA